MKVFSLRRRLAFGDESLDAAYCSFITSTINFRLKVCEETSFKASLKESSDGMYKKKKEIYPGLYNQGTTWRTVLSFQKIYFEPSFNYSLKIDSNSANIQIQYKLHYLGLNIT